MKAQWIPYSESSHPEKRGKYLVTRQSKYGFGKSVDLVHWADCLEEVDDYDFSGIRRGGWYFYDSEWGYREIDDVIAWTAVSPWEGN